MELGVFIPIANNGWIVSKTSPQYKPTFALNRDVTLLAEQYGFEFVLSMVKLRGWGGATEFWDHALESFTLMAGIAAVTQRIKLYASTAVLALPPAIVARMAATIDSIAPGRFGVNIVSGWAEAEYSQMGLWPGDQHYQKRYDYSTEYVTVMKELWETGRSDFKGEYFQMTDCRLSPRPFSRPLLVSAGQSDIGMKFAAEHTDYNFCLGEGVNTPKKVSSTIARLLAAVHETGRQVGAYALFMIIAADTDEAAQGKWESYKANKDLDALSWLGDQASADDKASVAGTAMSMINPVSPVNLNMGTLVGSYETVAQLMDELASVHGLAGVMLTFDDFIAGMQAFGEHIQPRMRSRQFVL